jgi:diguanylate cyclase (GGDEF)-like protein/PAS domain S-box-containing protein
VLDRQVLAAQATFSLGTSARYIVAYRASRHYPATLVMIGDRDLTLGSLDQKRRRARLIYLLVNLVVLGFIGALYGFYRRHEKLARELLNRSHAVDLHLMVSEYDQNGLLLRGNESFYRFNGYEPGELDGAHYSTLSGDLRVAELNVDLWTHLRDGQPWHGTLRNRRKSGELYWVSATVVPFRNVWGRLERVMVLMTDISESILLSERVEKEQRLREELARLNRDLATEAATDPLTGLPNKRGFDAFIQRAIEVSREAAQPIAVILLDIDHFKRVNDVYGHPAGDVLLKELSHRWRQEIRASDMLARIGGDEFCVVLPRTPAHHAERIAEKLRLAVAKSPVVVDLPGKELRLIETTASVGLVTAEVAAAATPEALVQAADGALYQAKDQGRDRVVAVTGD